MKRNWKHFKWLKKKKKKLIKERIQRFPKRNPEKMMMQCFP